MSNKIITGEKGRNKLQEGVNIVANAVKVTMGAKGRNVIYEDDQFNPKITKDGVTVADRITLRNHTKNLGASLVKEAAAKTVLEAGDGTTTTVVLVQAIINSGIKEVEQGAHPILLKKGLEKATDQIVAFLQNVSRPVDDHKTLIEIATISANNDEEIGRIIADAVNSVGKHGIITLEEGQSTETIVKTVEGMKIDSGYINHYFQTDIAKLNAVYEDAYIFLFDGKIPNIKDILPIMEACVRAGRPLVIIAEDIIGETLAVLTENKLKHGAKFLPINSPGVGANKRFILEDISAVTDAVVFDENSLNQFTSLNQLGRVGKVISNREETMFIDGYGTQETVKSRAEIIKQQTQSSTSDREKIFLSKRLAVLENGLAVIYVGGVTPTEIGEKLDRFDDALRATRSAQAEGFVAGGGSTFVHASKIFGDMPTEDILEYQTARTIMLQALWAPFSQILDNAGMDSHVCLSVILGGEYGLGYNVNTEMKEDMFDAGIIDPTKVLRVSITNAVSIASIFLTNECVITTENI